MNLHLIHLDLQTPHQYKINLDFSIIIPPLKTIYSSRNYLQLVFHDILETRIPKLQTERILLHLDLDAFFAAVEIRKNPSLQGKKLIVGNKSARKTGRGVVLTCSYEARVYGVRSGMSMLEALQRCPDAEISNDAREEYRSTSKRIMAFLKEFNTPISITSVDEAYLDLTDIVNSYSEAYYLALYIQKTITEREKITCSIGIGPTLKIAKIGSDFNKPNGTTVVTPNKIQSFLFNQKLTNIPGIGKKTGSRLQEKGYYTCGDLLNKNENELVELLGEYGSYLWKIFNGQTTNYIKTRGLRKSISHERTFHGKPLELDKFNYYLMKLFNKTHEALMSKNLAVRTLSIKVRYNGFDTITRAFSLSSPTIDRDIILTKLQDMTKEYFLDPRGIRLLGVRFSNLVKLDENETLDNFFN
ncbi:MAG: DNA polymerase IV [Candidatus Heimdallarchaeota archaeon LC_2]|nr:MAG: DNA polymerase IV [Candidatus Heimdallarchaeota archaeon LC_2]